MDLIRDRRRSVDLDEFLQRPLFAHLATASEHGPRTSPVWFLWEDGAIWILAHRTSSSFDKRIERDPRCSLGIVDADLTTGTVHHVGMRGRATVEAFDVARGRRLLSRYLDGPVEDWDPMFVEVLDWPDDYVFVRFEPETVVARDQSYATASTANADARGSP